MGKLCARSGKKRFTSTGNDDVVWSKNDWCLHYKTNFKTDWLNFEWEKIHFTSSFIKVRTKVDVIRSEELISKPPIELGCEGADGKVKPQKCLQIASNIVAEKAVDMIFFTSGRVIEGEVNCKPSEKESTRHEAAWVWLWLMILWGGALHLLR